MDYFSGLKIRHACTLLETTNAAVGEIGVEIGYADPYYFSRLFRQVMGMSSRAYRDLPKG